MGKVILYTTADGFPAITTPFVGQRSLEDIAAKDTPAGLDYMITDDADVPAWQAGKLVFRVDGVGVGAVAFFIAEYDAEIEAIYAEVDDALELPPPPVDQDAQRISALNALILSAPSPVDDAKVMATAKDVRDTIAQTEAVAAHASAVAQAQANTKLYAEERVEWELKCEVLSADHSAAMTEKQAERDARIIQVQAKILNVTT